MNQTKHEPKNLFYRKSIWAGLIVPLTIFLCISLCFKESLPEYKLFDRVYVFFIWGLSFLSLIGYKIFEKLYVESDENSFLELYLKLSISACTPLIIFTFITTLIAILIKHGSVGEIIYSLGKISAVIISFGLPLILTPSIIYHHISRENEGVDRATPSSNTTPL
jgi:hypothetical protein